MVNAIRDLLKLADVADVENGVSGDALINFDNEAEASLPKGIFSELVA